MGDYRGGRFERESFERKAAEPEASLAATMELGFRRLVTSVFVAGGLIAIAVYAGSGGGEAPRYQVTAADGRIIRVNTQSGTVIACQEGRCAVVLRRGQDLEEEGPERVRPPQLPERVLPPQLPPQAQPKAAPALPAPAPAPAEPAEPAAPDAPTR